MESARISLVQRSASAALPALLVGEDWPVEGHVHGDGARAAHDEAESIERIRELPVTPDRLL